MISPLEREMLVKNICTKLNRITNLKSTMDSVITDLKKLTKCDAIGLRLHENGDYPYYSYDGFSKSFILKENSLCVKDASKDKCNEPDCNNNNLECMCGNIVKGNFDPELSFFTKKGSFWTNDTNEPWLSEAIEKYTSNIRGNCVKSGYLSVALIPIKSNGEIIGLLQINSKQKGMFDLQLIEYLEAICEALGMAIDNNLIHIKLKEDEELLRIREMIEKVKFEFFINMSHELRTPINVILSTIQLMSANIKKEGTNNEYNEKYLKIAKQNCFRLIRLVNNILDITRIDSGLYELRMSNYDIVEMIEKITLSVKDFVEYKGLKLKFSKSIGSRIIACDPEKIEMILLNLLSNATKYSEYKGTVTVRVESKNEKIIISVKDQGIGIPKENLEKIFERYKQLDNSLIRNYEGYGIGLALVKTLVEMHDGTIYVRSTPGKGSKFIVELPIKVLKDSDKAAKFNSKINKRIDKLDVYFSDIYEL